jgi:hypothetical protein
MAAADSTPGSGTPDDATPAATPAGAAVPDDNGDRPGDIPFDQAAAEHENPDLA